MNERERLLTVILGAAGTGKTTYIRRIVKSYPGKVLIMDSTNEWPDIPVISSSRLSLWSRGQARTAKRVARVALTNPEQQIDHAIRYARDCLLVFDDLDMYTWMDNKLMRPIFVSYRHYGWDVVVVFHSVKRAYKPAIENMKRLVIFAQDPGSTEALEKLGFQVPRKAHEMRVYRLQ